MIVGMVTKYKRECPYLTLLVLCHFGQDKGATPKVSTQGYPGVFTKLFFHHLPTTASVIAQGKSGGNCIDAADFPPSFLEARAEKHWYRY